MVELNRIKQMFMGNDTEARPVIAPRVSIILIVYDMPEQARNTLISLGPDYQIGTRPGDYEVIIVENESPRLLATDFLASLPDNFRYLRRREDDPTPVHAINFGAQQAAGEILGAVLENGDHVVEGQPVEPQLIVG